MKLTVTNQTIPATSGVLTAGTTSNTLSGVSYTYGTYGGDLGYGMMYDGKDISKNFIGWDKDWRDLELIGQKIIKNTGNFPPYDIVQYNPDCFMIKMAIAGYEKNNLQVRQEGNLLIVEGQIDEGYEEGNIKNGTFKTLHKGISQRSFIKTFPLAKYIEVDNVQLVNGMLWIELNRNIPDTEIGKKFDILEPNPNQFLTE